MFTKKIYFYSAEVYENQQGGTLNRKVCGTIQTNLHGYNLYNDIVKKLSASVNCCKEQIIMISLNRI